MKKILQLLSVLLMATQVAKAAGRDVMYYEGKAKDSAGYPLNDVYDFILEIYEPTANCVLYREKHASVDIREDNDGRFSLAVGSGTLMNSSPALKDAFVDGTKTGPTTFCSGTIGTGAQRFLRVRYAFDGTTATAPTFTGFTLLSPNVPLGSAPNAMMADRATTADFVKVPNAPANGQILKWFNAGWIASDDATGAGGGVSTFNSRTGAVTSQSGDYSFSQLSGSISTAMLSSDAVTSSKILDGTILSADLASGSVTSDEIQDGTITSADLSSGAVAYLGGGNFVSKSGDTMTGDLLFGGSFRVKNLASPVASADATNKDYVNTAIASAVASKQDLLGFMPFNPAVGGTILGDVSFSNSSDISLGQTAILRLGRFSLSQQSTIACSASSDASMWYNSTTGSINYCNGSSIIALGANASGGSGDVTSFNGRSGVVLPASSDYSFAQISGSVVSSMIQDGTIASSDFAPTAIYSSISHLSKVGIGTASSDLTATAVKLFVKDNLNYNPLIVSGPSGGMGLRLSAGGVHDGEVRVSTAGSVISSDNSGVIELGINGGTPKLALSASGRMVTNVVSTDLSGAVKVGAQGTYVRGIGACNISSFSPSGAGPLDKLCPGVKAGSAVTCSPLTYQNAVTWSVHAPTDENLRFYFSGPGATSTWACSWVLPMP